MNTLHVSIRYALAAIVAMVVAIVYVVVSGHFAQGTDAAITFKVSGLGLAVFALGLGVKAFSRRNE